MKHFVLTPFVLDRLEPQLLHLWQDGWTLNEPSLPKGTVTNRLAILHESIATLTERSVRLGERPVSIAGDCVAAIGVITGLQRAGIRPRLLWLDAHGDFNTPETSPSGLIAGMPLAMLVGRGDQSILRHLGTQALNEPDIVLCDARNLDPRESEELAASRLVHVPSAERLDVVDFGSDPLHVHIDADVLRTSDAPAMVHQTADGPSVETLATVLAGISRRSRVAAVSVRSWLPDRRTGATRMAVWRIVDAALAVDTAPNSTGA